MILYDFFVLSFENHVAMAYAMNSAETSAMLRLIQNYLHIMP
jgi:hypothetical protein